MQTKKTRGWHGRTDGNLLNCTVFTLFARIFCLQGLQNDEDIWQIFGFHSTRLQTLYEWNACGVAELIQSMEVYRA